MIEEVKKVFKWLAILSFVGVLIGGVGYTLNVAQGFFIILGGYATQIFVYSLTLYFFLWLAGKIKQKIQGDQEGEKEVL